MDFCAKSNGYGYRPCIDANSRRADPATGAPRSGRVSRRREAILRREDRSEEKILRMDVRHLEPFKSDTVVQTEDQGQTGFALGKPQVADLPA